MGKPRINALSEVMHIISSGGLYGAERSILGLMQSVKGYSFKVVCFEKADRSHQPFVDAVTELGIPVQLLLDELGSIRSNVKILANLNKSAEPLLVHAHGYKAVITAGLVARRVEDCRSVFTQHGFTGKSRKTRFYTNLETQMLKYQKSSPVICASNAIREFYLSKRIAAERLHYVANAVALPEQQSASTAAASRDIDFVYLGRLSIEKGPDLLMEAVAEMSFLGRKPRVSIVGDGPLRGELERKVQELGLSDMVKFEGFQTNPNAWLSRAKWLVMPSRTEGLPMSLLEAMALGTPAIATQVGEVPTVLESGDVGRLIAPNSPSALALTMGEALDASEPAWATTSSAARDLIASRYSLERYGREIADVYAQAYGLQN